MATYGWTVKWGDMTIGVNGCKTCEEAKQQAIEIATIFGWTPLRWLMIIAYWKYFPTKHIR